MRGVFDGRFGGDGGLVGRIRTGLVAEMGGGKGRWRFNCMSADTAVTSHGWRRTSIREQIQIEPYVTVKVKGPFYSSCC